MQHDRLVNAVQTLPLRLGITAVHRVLPVELRIAHRNEVAVEVRDAAVRVRIHRVVRRVGAQLHRLVERGVVGRLGAHVRLRQRLHWLLNEIPDAVLYIAGDGPEKNRLLELSYELRQRGKVVLLGALPKETLARYIKAADIFLLNTFYEGFSHQLLEVMSLGTPLVTTTAGGNPELAEDGKDALLVQYNNKEALFRATLRILHEEGLANSLSFRAREKVWQFSKERAVADFIKECKS